MYGQREVATYQDDKKKQYKTFIEIFVIRVICGLVVSVLFTIFSLYNQYKIFLLLQFITILGTIIDISWYFQGREEFQFILIRNILVKSTSLILIFLLVRKPDDLYIYILVLSISVLASNLIVWPSALKNKVSIKLADLNLKKHIRPTFEFFIPLVAVQIYSNLDKIMLGWITKDEYQNGFYEQARKIVSIIVTLVNALSTVLMPRISNMIYNKETTNIKELYRESFNMLKLIVFPITFGLWVIADSFTIWFFGTAYDEVAILLKISCPMILFMAVGNFVGVQYLCPTNKQNIMSRIYIISAVVNIALNLLLIKILLARGALIASVVAEFISCVLQVWILQKSEYRFKIQENILKYLIASLIMAGVGNIIGFILDTKPIVITFVQITVCAFVYFVVLIVLRESTARKCLMKLKNQINR
jgi:O-antigen/teichoic acid export membrane protein